MLRKFPVVLISSKYRTVDLEEIWNITIQIMEEKALCHQDPDQDQDHERMEDQAEYDSVLIYSAGDLVADLPPCSVPTSTPSPLSPLNSAYVILLAFYCIG